MSTKEFSNDEILNRLNGYITVKPEYWHLIKNGTHVRYIDDTGKFKIGGFMHKNKFVKKDPTGLSLNGLILKSTFNTKDANYKTWPVMYKSIKFLYAKGNGVEYTLYTAINGILESTNKAFAEISLKNKTMYSEIKHLHAENKKLKHNQTELMNKMTKILELLKRK